MYPDVLPGQVKISERGGAAAAPPEGALAAARTIPVIRDQDPVQMRFLTESNIDEGEHVVAGDFYGLMVAVDTHHDAERLLGAPLTDNHAGLLRNGGVLLWGGTHPEQTIPLRMSESDHTGEPLARIPAREYSIRTAIWNQGMTGLMLTETAEHHDLPLVAGSLMFTGVSDADAEAVRTALERAAIDPETAEMHREPPAPIPPLALYLTAAGVVCLAVVMTVSLTRAQVRVLRDHLGHLIALGVPVRWVRHVNVRQHGVLLGFATILGLIIGLPTALMAATIIPQFELSIPWGQLVACRI